METRLWPLGVRIKVVNSLTILVFWVSDDLQEHFLPNEVTLVRLVKMNTKEVQIVHFRITFSLLSKNVLVSIL